MTLPLGGSKLPAHAVYIIDPAQPRGQLACRVTVIDRATNATKSLVKQFDVLPANFGTVALTINYDREAQNPAPLLAMAGQALWLHFGVVGIGRDPQTKQPNVTAEVRVTDQAGKATNERPFVAMLDPKAKFDEKDPGVLFNIPLPLNRTGDFTVELKTECKVTGKSYKMSFPVRVLPPPK